MWAICPECGKDVEVEGGQTAPMRALCEECFEAKEQEVEQAWQTVLKRSNAN